MNDFELVIPSKGAHLEGVLAGLICHAPLPIRLILKHYPTGERTALLIETLRYMGCSIEIELDRGNSIGSARAQAIMTSRADVIVMLDDDAAVVPPGGILRLANEASHCNWVSPIIRYTHNFIESGMPDHTEIWELVGRSDPRVVRSLRANGQGWSRVYEFGETQFSDRMGGTCFAATRKSMGVTIPAITGQNVGEDYTIGRMLGEGKILSGVYAYHWGKFTPQEWGMDKIAHQLQEDMPHVFAKYSKRLRQ